MSLPSASAFLVVATVKNRLLLQLRRLRQPKYLVATAAGALYLATFMLGRGRGGVWSPRTPDTLPVVELVLAVLSIAFALSGWVIGGDEAGLRFTEAEIQLLFPGPVSRRALLHYKLIRTLLVAFASACLVSLFVGARLATHRAFFLLGVWLALSTLSLHWIAASLTRASFVEHAMGRRRQVVTAGVLGGAFVVLIVGLALAPMPAAATMRALGAWATSLVETSPLAWILLPARAPIRVALARSVPELLPALPAALMVPALHYVWVLSSGIAFEQASLERAERAAKNADGRRGDPGRILRRAKPLFRLQAVGDPWVGLFWKNLIAATRLLSLRLLIALAIVMVGGAVTALGVHGPSARFGALGATCAAAAAFLALLGPQALRIDLRLDLPRMDLLRSYPLRGRDIVAAEVLAPAAVLAAAEWLLVLGAAVLSSGLSQLLPAPARAAIAVAAGIVLPTLTTCGLLVQNAAVLLFPGWISAESPGRGIEAVGQRLLTLAGGLVVIMFGLLPASLVGGVVVAILWRPMGLLAVPVGSAAGALVVAAEIRIVLGLLGRAFERFDLSVQ